MGREIRKVPKGWEHPKNDNGNYIPLHSDYYLDALNDWFKEHELWQKKQHPSQLREDPEDYEFYAESWGDPPSVDSYVKYKPEDATCFQVYETVSEGTPKSPVFDTMDELKAWLIKEGHSEKAATAFCESGWAPSGIMMGGNFKTNIDSYDL